MHEVTTFLPAFYFHAPPDMADCVVTIDKLGVTLVSEDQVATQERKLKEEEGSETAEPVVHGVLMSVRAAVSRLRIARLSRQFPNSME